MLVNQNAVGFSSVLTDANPNDTFFLASEPIFISAPNRIYKTQGKNLDSKIVGIDNTNYGHSILTFYLTYDMAGFLFRELAGTSRDTATVANNERTETLRSKKEARLGGEPTNSIVRPQKMFYTLGSRKLTATAFIKGATIRPNSDGLIVCDVDVFYFNSLQRNFTFSATKPSVMDLTSLLSTDTDSYLLENGIDDFEISVNTGVEEQRKMDGSFKVEGGRMSVTSNIRGTLAPTPTTINRADLLQRKETITFSFSFSPLDPTTDGAKLRVELESEFILEDYNPDGRFDSSIKLQASLVSPESFFVMRRISRSSGSTPVTPAFVPSPYNMVPMVV